MSVLFGEVVEPSTRAFWDNYEDYVVDQESKIRLNLVWSKDCDETLIPDKFKTLLVVEGVGITSLINALTEKGKHLCRISNSDIAVYRISDELIVCASNESDLNRIGEAANLIEPFIRNAEMVIGVAIQTSANYSGKFNDGECFIRGINSSIDDIKPLEVPNFITGLVAGCATYRLHSSLDMGLYACFVPTPFFDLAQIKPIIDLLEKLAIPVNASSFNQNRENYDMYM